MVNLKSCSMERIVYDPPEQKPNPNLALNRQKRGKRVQKQIWVTMVTIKFPVSFGAHNYFQNKIIMLSREVQVKS